MKKTMILMTGLLLVVQAQARDLYRPYFSCSSADQKTNIDIAQNTNLAEVKKAYTFDIARNVEGSKITILHQNAVKVTPNKVGIIEMFQSYQNPSSYRFNLVVTSRQKNMGYVSQLIDNYGRVVVYCNRVVTFGR